MSDALGTVARIRGVRCALLASANDGIPVQSVAHVDVDVEALAAFAVALYRRARQTAEASECGLVRCVSLEAEGGRLVAAVRDDLLAVALADRDAHPGLLRIALQRAVTALV